MYVYIWLPTGGVNTNGAAAKEIIAAWGKSTPWHFWKTKVG